MLRDWLVEIKIRLDRGNSLIYWLRNIIIIVTGLKYILTLNILQTFIVGIIGILMIYFLGWLDLNLFKFAQREAEINTEKYNPFFTKLKKSVTISHSQKRKTI